MLYHTESPAEVYEGGGLARFQIRSDFDDRGTIDIDIIIMLKKKKEGGWRVAGSLILKVNLVRPYLPRSSQVPSSFGL
jgi:hypothetical protein